MSEEAFIEAAEESVVQPILAAIRASGRMLVTSHARPDGDAVGSVLAMGEILAEMGCRADLVLADPVPAIYRFLPGVERIRCAASLDEAGIPLDTPALLLECDCPERTGLAGLEGRCLINIDHHASGKSFAQLNWIHDDACAVAAMVYGLAVEAGVKITPSMATCLYAAVLSDTGSFTYPGTNAPTFALAHELVLHGASPSEIAREVYFSNPESKMRLLGTALTAMRRDHGIAWTRVTQKDMEDAGAATEDCEGVVNYLIGMAGVECAIFLREIEGGRRFRVSLRSKGRVDVAKIAEMFGGGGHRSASGCTMEGPLEAATEQIVRELKAKLSDPPRERV